MNDPTQALDLQRLARLLGTALTVLYATTAILLMVWTGAAVVAPDVSYPSAGPMMEVSPGGVIEPDSVPEAIAVHYRAAHDNPDIFAAVPCYCGCADMLGHRNLLECFRRPDGIGWEAHAVGCGVCLGEAQQVEELLDAGHTDGADIEEAVTLEWGDPYRSDR